MPEPALEVVGLDFTYPDGTPGLREVSFAVARGEAVALLGANGSGKSTLLLNLIGVLRGKGTIRVLGTELSPGTLKEIRRKTGVLFQDVDSQLFSPRVLDDVAFGPLNLGKSGEEAEAAARRALREVGLEGYEKRAPHHLSFGEKKRVAIATALALSPDLLLLDEPTAGLDPRSASELLDLLGTLKDSGKTIVATTHDLHFATELMDRVVVIAKGRVAAQGDPRELLKDEALLVAYDLVHRHRHRHARGRGLPLLGGEAHGHAHAHDHGHAHGHGREDDHDDEHDHDHAHDHDDEHDHDHGGQQGKAGDGR